jgi:hypothetical protein
MNTMVQQQLPLETLISNMQCFMLTHDTMASFYEKNTEEVIVTQPENVFEQLCKEAQKQYEPECIQPKQTDTLFWCLYIAKYGYAEYMMIHNNYGSKELEIKSQAADFIKKNASKLKETNYKLTKVTIQEILSDLLTSQKDTTMYCLLAIICYFEIHVCITDAANDFLIEFRSHIEDAPVYLIQKMESGRFHIHVNPLSQAEQTEWKTNVYVFESFYKALKSMGDYKIEDLYEIAKKLNINYMEENGKKCKKKDLYELIYYKTAPFLFAK